MVKRLGCLGDPLGSGGSFPVTFLCCLSYKEKQTRGTGLYGKLTGFQVGVLGHFLPTEPPTAGVRAGCCWLLPPTAALALWATSVVSFRLPSVHKGHPVMLGRMLSLAARQPAESHGQFCYRQ